VGEALGGGFLAHMKSAMAFKEKRMWVFSKRTVQFLGVWFCLWESFFRFDVRVFVRNIYMYFFYFVLIQSLLLFGSLRVKVTGVVGWNMHRFLEYGCVK